MQLSGRRAGTRAFLCLKGSAESVCPGRYERGMSLPVSLWVKLTHVHPGAQEYSGEEARVRQDPV